MKEIFVLLSILSVISCTTLNYPSEDILNKREELRSKRSFGKGLWQKADSIFDEYYVECIDEVEGAKYYPIWFSSIGEKMNGIIFSPKDQSRGTVVLIHGYAGNIIGFRKIINKLLKENYTVAALSLPGHGIAGGERGGIGEFDQYGEVVYDFYNVIKERTPEPFFAVSHSTGSSSLLIFNENYNWPFKSVVFLAPLIRSYSWRASVIGRTLTRPFVSHINTKWEGVLALHVVPLTWFDKLYLWNKRISSYSGKNDNILILQGKKDKVVSWRYNVKFIKKKYPGAEIILYPEGSHTFFKGDEFEDSMEKILNHFETTY